MKIKTKHLTIELLNYHYGWFNVLPIFSIQHKFWYLWEINIGWLWGDWMIEVCRQDWKHKGDFDDSKDN